MRFRELRQLFQQIVIAGLPAAGCTGEVPADPVDGDCVTTHYQRTFEIDTPAVASLQLRIESCQLDIDACRALCIEAMRVNSVGPTPSSCDVEFTEDAAHVSVTWSHTTECSGVGRKPAGLCMPGHVDARSPAGAWLAQAAWLEAASVHSFVHLARELEQHGAPRVLVRLALAAARDEVRHAVIMTRLATRYGARPAVPEVVTPALRTLEDIATENAVEGCVRETFGAIVALWQSHTARDPELRSAFRMIARDEARHAALAWAVDAWLAPQLDASARDRVARARTTAANELAELPLPAPIVELGQPDARALAGLVTRTHQALWTGGAA